MSLTQFRSLAHHLLERFRDDNCALHEEKRAMDQYFLKRLFLESRHIITKKVCWANFGGQNKGQIRFQSEKLT